MDNERGAKVVEAESKAESPVNLQLARRNLQLSTLTFTLE